MAWLDDDGLVIPVGGTDAAVALEGPPGPPGPAGPGPLFGHGAPTGAGVAGQVYIDLDTGELYVYDTDGADDE